MTPEQVLELSQNLLSDYIKEQEVEALYKLGIRDYEGAREHILLKQGADQLYSRLYFYLERKKEIPVVDANKIKPKENGL